MGVYEITHGGAKYRITAPDENSALKAMEALPSTDPESRIKADEVDAYNKFKNSYSGSFGAVSNGLTAGYGDEISAAAEGAAGFVGALFDDRNATDEYKRQSDQYKRFANQAQDEFGQENPVASVALNTVGAMGTGVAGGMTKLGANVAGRIGRMGLAGRTASTAALGTAGGAVTGFGEGEGDVENRVLSAAKSAVVGGLFGGVMAPIGDVAALVGKRYGPRVANLFLKKDMYSAETGLTNKGAKALARLGEDPNEVSKTFAADFEGQIRNAVEPAQAARYSSLKEFDIPASRANITGTPEDFAFESSARKGSIGGGAGTIMREFDEGQRVAIDAAKDKVSGGLGGGARLAADATEASGMALDGVLAKAASKKAAADQAYDTVSGMTASIDADFSVSVPSRIRQKLVDMDFIVDGGTPKAARALDIVENAFSGRTKPISTAENISGDVPIIPFQQVERARQRVGNMLRAAKKGDNSEEVAALGKIRDAFDVEIDTALDAGLINGDEGVVDAIKNARSLYASYKAQFAGKKGADNFIRKMVEGDASPREVASWLYGNSRVGSPKQSAQFATKLKDILGEGDEWDAIRQGAWQRVSSGIEGSKGQGPQKTASAIRGFIRGPERDLANALFSESERKTMLRFAKSMDVLTPPDGAINHSNTAEAIKRSLGQAADVLVTAKTGVPGATSLVRDFRNKLRSKAFANGIVPRKNASNARILGQAGSASGAASGVVSVSENPAKSDESR